MSWLDGFFAGVLHIASGGAAIAQKRDTLNFVGTAVTVADNPSTQQTDVTVSFDSRYENVDVLNNVSATDSTTAHDLCTISVPIGYRVDAHIHVDGVVTSGDDVGQVWLFDAITTYKNRSGTIATVTPSTPSFGLLVQSDETLGSIVGLLTGPTTSTTVKVQVKGSTVSGTVKFSGWIRLTTAPLT